MEKWKTKISAHKEEKFYIRGEDLLKLIPKLSFIEMIFLLWQNRLPKKNEERMFNAMLTASAEHGIEPPSTFVARSVISSTLDLSGALAAGILAIGKRHGGAIEKIAQILFSEKSPRLIVQETLAAKEKLAGFGHRIYKKGDPRVKVLFFFAKKLKCAGKFTQKILTLEGELAKQSGKHIPLNIDGTLGALLLDLGFHWQFAKPLFILARVAGIAAHSVEEMQESAAYRRLSEDDIEYVGSELKP